ncbi:hypothetical protein DPMN_194551 [Dreissena polymorpha]|nr:hypothetical protein DPMN_194551 [Dreissena polymorpha]
MVGVPKITTDAASAGKEGSIPPSTKASSAMTTVNKTEVNMVTLVDVAKVTSYAAGAGKGQAQIGQSCSCNGSTVLQRQSYAAIIFAFLIRYIFTVL